MVLRTMRALALPVTLMLLLAMDSCRIEPPLKLADNKQIDIMLPEVVTDINLVWEIDPNWKDQWWYGWEEADINRWGPLEYPTPESYEVRIYKLGDMPDAPYCDIARNTIWGSSFRRRFDIGYHNMFIWSNIVSHDGTQSVIFNEDDPDNIHATTSRSRLNYAPPLSRGGDVFNNPDIFYGTRMRNVCITDNPEDYDYFDQERNVWVKNLRAELVPMVYTYLVQYVIYNNKGRILGTADRASISSLADGVSIHTGTTSANDVFVAYEMGMKKELQARDGKKADIIGGKLTTFGLCEMEPWSKSRGSRYTGRRSDLINKLMVPLAFNNAGDSVYTYDITPQMQAQAHGGVITIEIDADTLTLPRGPNLGPSQGFVPTVAPRDSIDYNFTL